MTSRSWRKYRSDGGTHFLDTASDWEKAAASAGTRTQDPDAYTDSLVSIATVLADPRAPSSEREGVAFPILLAAGAVESLYCGDGIPRLYVLDPTGSIRFDQHGWFHDENSRNRLDWMIEASLRTER